MPDFPWKDKAIHFAFFAGGAFLMSAYLQAWWGQRWKRIFVTTLIVFAILGAVDEWHQLSVVGRSGGDIFDWLADVLGTMGGVAALKGWHGFRNRNRTARCETAGGNPAT